MRDNSCYFEPTDTLNGIPISSCGCQASGLYGQCAVEGRNMIAVTHLAIARSQNTRFGILGPYTKEEAVITTAFSFVWVWLEKTSKPAG